MVDDEDDSRALAATILRGAGASVVTECSSVNEAFSAFSANAPDVLVTDVAMPGEDGYSLLRRVRDLLRRSAG